MIRFLFVCLAGGAGSGARYLFGTGVQRLTGGGFPYGTIGVNLIGSCLIVIIMQLGLVKGAISPDTRVILATGFVGGFTTYSAFNYETLSFFEQGQTARATGYAAAMLLGCAAAGALGLWSARTLVGSM
jgi:CrcB protein